MTPEAQQEEIDKKSARKFLWILMLIPIGLGVGVVLSNINFRRVEANKNDVTQFRISQEIRRDGLVDDIQKLFTSQSQSSDYFLRHISSTLGINNYLTMKPSSDEGASLGFFDIKGKKEDAITAVIVELDEKNAVAKSSLVAITSAVIQGLAGEREFSFTLRFIFLPSRFSGKLGDLTQKGEKLKQKVFLRAGGNFTINDPILWKISEDNNWQHPATDYPHESVSDRITEGQIELSLQAARQLKVRLLDLMQK